jgi:phytoene/squalene synthetase
MLSAAPVGRLVLAVLGCATPERVAQSDRVCVGLQVVEHLQDVAEDFAMGRVYLPVEDLERCGCSLDELVAKSQRSGLKAAVFAQVERARSLLADGAPLAGSLPVRFRLAVAGFSAGGAAALDAIEKAGFDVVASRCRPRPSRLALHWLAGLRSPAQRASS